MTEPMSKTDIALIGLGAIGSYIANAWRADESWGISHVVLREDRISAYRPALPEGARPVSGPNALTDPRPGLAVECAGQPALREHAAGVLAAGIDLVICSVGALADPALLDAFRDAAEKSGAKIFIPAGAVGGIDVLGAARQGGLAGVRYTSRKPPEAWAGSPAEQIIDLRKIDRATTFYEGTAGEAALRFPKNANVAATVALAGIGFESTEVALMADPEADGNTHRVSAWGAFGEFDLEIRANALPDQPGSSALTPMSLLRAIRNRTGVVEI